MAFLRTANAIVVKPQTSQQGWSKVRTAANLSPEIPSQNLIAQASEILGTPFDPKRYLLSHVTIVASVDVESGPNIKLGSIVENGQKINRKYLDYRIKASSDPLINSNLDAFGRAVLLKSYKTFVGGENFCFVAGTPVLMADGTYKPIEGVRVGEKVQSLTGTHSVGHTFSHKYTGDMVTLAVSGVSSPITCTADHPFPVQVRVGKDPEIQPAEMLIVGAKLVAAPVPEGSEPAAIPVVTAVQKQAVTNVQVYNFEVEEEHYYVVGGIVTHNCEHVQIPELSKGKILDAVPREVGDSIYIDILVATDRSTHSLSKTSSLAK